MRRADIVVTATGVRGALAGRLDRKLLAGSRALIANMGVEDEFGELVSRARVLNGKAPLNFTLEEPTHLKYIDTSLALHAALGERLLKDWSEAGGGVPFRGPHDPPAELEQHLLMTTIQNGAIGQEVCDMLR